MSPRTITRNVDRLGEIKAHIAALTKEYDKIKAKLIDEGVEVAEGKLFKVCISDFLVQRVDYKGLVEDYLEVDDDMLKEYTTVDQRQRVSVNSR